MKIELGQELLPQGLNRAGGVVLRRREGRAHAQELLLLLQGLGMAWVGAPGADGSKNRFGGGTEPMTWATFELYQSPRRLYLKSVDVKEAFWAVRKSQNSLRTAIAWLRELSSRLPLRAENDALLSLLWGCMRNLAAGASPGLLNVRFVWRWSNLWGTAPPLDRCVECGREIEFSNADFVYPALDGLLCGMCGSALSSCDPGNFCRSLSPAALQELRYAAMLPKDRFLQWAVARSSGSSDTSKELEECVAWLYSFL